MSKRKIHSLDSDEEDEVKDTGELHVDDIEGQEDGIAKQVEGQRMTAFNMKEEMGDGHFDKNGHFIWNNEEEIQDNWLDNVDWQKIKHDPNSQYNLIENAGLGEDSDSSDEAFDETNNYQEMLNFMKPGETVNKALSRLGGKNEKLSSVERLKRKKAGTLVENQDVIKLTALANDNLTSLGNMNVYQETYESISAKLQKKLKPLEAVDDMYADDFDCSAKPSSSKSAPINETPENNEVMWEFKWKQDSDEVHGPHSSSQMLQWVKEGYFKSGVFVRKQGENANFYASNRIDFELYV